MTILFPACFRRRNAGRQLRLLVGASAAAAVPCRRCLPMLTATMASTMSLTMQVRVAWTAMPAEMTILPRFMLLLLEEQLARIRPRIRLRIRRLRSRDMQLLEALARSLGLLLERASGGLGFQRQAHQQRKELSPAVVLLLAAVSR